MWHLATFFKLNENDNKILNESLDIINSINTSKSIRVHDSKNIFLSEDVSSSSDVVDSKVIEQGNSIYKSEFIFYSTDVFQSFNISNSINISKSSRIIKSANVYRSEDITSSNIIEFSKNLKDCYGCTNCTNLTNSLFCSYASGENLIFNQPQSEERINIYTEQFLYFKPRLYLCDFDRNLPHAIIPKVNNDFSIHYSSLNPNFWKWIESLPGYNKDILYQITYNKNLYLS